MKKTILIILAVLPIVLLLVIAFAGQILSFYQHISVERVEFVDRAGNAYGDVDFELEMGDTVKLPRVRIYPANASDPSVTYVSQNPEICTVDAEGNLTGVHFGATTVLVKSTDGSRTSLLHVKVNASVPYAVYLSHETLSLTLGETFDGLTADVDAPVAVNQLVTYESSDVGVITVNPLGHITAVGEGTATVTVRTVLGDCTDTCTVTVKRGVLPIEFDFSQLEGVAMPEGSHTYFTTVSEIDLRECIKVSDEVNIEDVRFEITSGTKYATIGEDGDTVVFTAYDKLVTVRAYVEGTNYSRTVDLIFTY